MTLANRVKNTIESHKWAGLSLYAGYGKDSETGQLIGFLAGNQLKQTVNNNGRVIFAVYSYADDSVLTYRYDEDARTESFST